MLHPRCAATRLSRLVGTLLAFAVVVDGRKCYKRQVFSNGDYERCKLADYAYPSPECIASYTFDKIPEDCTTLNLYMNNIGVTGATALAQMLKSNTGLAGLYLDGNNLGDDGATALAEALKYNNALTTLDLNYNNIGNNGATALAGALESNTALTTLWLARNDDIGIRGATAISKATKGKAITVEGLPALQVGARAGLGATFGAILLAFAAYYIYDGYIKPYLTKRRTYRAFGRAHSIIIRTLAGGTYTLTDWGLCKDLKVALCKLALADAIGKPATFQLLGDLDVASGDSNSSNQKMIDTKYGSDDRERMMQAKVVTGFNFEFALVYQGGGVEERRVGGGGDKGGMGGAATNVYDVTGNAPMRMGSSTAV